MNAKAAEFKSKAIKLRSGGLSYNEIRKEVHVAKSTLSLWLKDIRLKPEYRKRLYTKQIEILSRGSQSQKERREREIKRILDSASNEISLPVSSETYKLFGAALYWAEGNKTRDFAITNSDPYLILFMVRWFEKIFYIKPKNLRASLNIYSQQNENQIKKFWSQLTNIPLKNFGKSYIKPLNKNYKKNNLYYGTIKLRAIKGTDLRYRSFGWVNAVLKNIEPKIQLTQNKWRSLKENKRPVNLL